MVPLTRGKMCASLIMNVYITFYLSMFSTWAPSIPLPTNRDNTCPISQLNFMDKTLQNVSIGLGEHHTSKPVTTGNKDTEKYLVDTDRHFKRHVPCVDSFSHRPNGLHVPILRSIDHGLQYAFLELKKEHNSIPMQTGIDGMTRYPVRSYRNKYEGSTTAENGSTRPRLIKPHSDQNENGHMLMNFGKEVVADSYRCTSNGFNGIQSHPDMVLAQHGREDNDSRERGSKILPDIPEPTGNTNGYEIRSKRPIIDYHYHEDETLLRNIMSTSLGDIPIFSPNVQAQCWYGESSSKRAHNWPLLDEGKSYALVDKPIPYQHGEGHMNDNNILQGLMTYENLRNSVDTSCMMQYNDILDQFVPSEDYTGENCEMSSFIHIVAEKGLNSGSLKAGNFKQTDVDHIGTSFNKELRINSHIGSFSKDSRPLNTCFDEFGTSLRSEEAASKRISESYNQGSTTSENRSTRPRLIEPHSDDKTRHTLINFRKEVVADSYQFTRNGFDGIQSHPDMILAQHGEEDNDSCERGRKTLPITPEPDGKTNGYEIKSKRPIIDHHYHEDETLLRNIMSTSLGDIPIFSPNVQSQCRYGESSSKRAHNWPVFDGGKSCALVDKPIPYQHGEGHMNENKLLKGLMTYENLQNPVGTSCMILCNEVLEQFVPYENYTGANCETSCFIHTVADKSLNSGSLKNVHSKRTDVNQIVSPTLNQGTYFNNNLHINSHIGLFPKESRLLNPCFNEFGTSLGSDEAGSKGISERYIDSKKRSRDSEYSGANFTPQVSQPEIHEFLPQDKERSESMEGLLDTVIERMLLKFFGVKRLVGRGQIQDIIGDLLIDEGDLLLGKFPEMSMEISKALSRNLRHMKYRNNSGMQVINSKRLDIIYTIVRSGLIRSFLGLLKYLHNRDGKTTLTHSDARNAYEFLVDYFSTWRKLVYKGQKSDYNQGKKELDWTLSSSIFKYLESLTEATKWRRSLVWIVWNNFMEWSQSHKIRGSINTDRHISLDHLIMVHSHRSLKYQNLQPDMNDVKQLIPPKICKRRKFFQNNAINNNLLVENDKPQKYIELGADLVKKNTGLLISIEDYFHCLQKDLRLNVGSILLEDMCADLKHILAKTKNKDPSSQNMASLVDNCIYICKEKITYALLGSVLVFQKNLGGSARVDLLVDHGWKFLQEFFSGWKDHSIKAGLRDNLFLEFCHKPKNTPDWTNPLESFYYCLIYSQYSHLTSKIFAYLSHQWVDQVTK